MASPQQLIAFLRSCHEADNRDTAVLDLLDDRVRHLHFPLLGWELVSGRLDRVPLPREQALAAAREAALLETEKTLLFGALILAGRHDGRTLCAPLLLFPAHVEDADPNAFLRVDAEQRRLNLRALAALLPPGDAAAVDSLAERLPELPLGAGELERLAGGIAAILPRVDLSPLGSDPRSVTEETVRAAAAGRRLRLLPATALALLPNSPETREVLGELATLAAATVLGPPLAALFGAAPNRRPAPPPAPMVPASLSGPQRQVLRAAASSDLTVIVGPPGTGKSYTVAATALDHALRGQSVLIAARTEQALDVLEDKLCALSGGELPLARGGGTRAPRLGELLERLLGGAAPEAVPNAPGPRRIAARVRRLVRRVAACERSLTARAGMELAWGDLDGGPAAAAARPARLARPRRALLDFRLRRRPPYWRQMAGYLQTLDELEAATAELVRATLRSGLEHALQSHRQDLVALGRALRARTKRTLEGHFTAIDRRALLGALPVWLTTLAEVGDLLPLEAGLFDLAIVDEATQCDLASALPVLHRAARAAVTGDPRQLRHVSFLSETRLAHIAARHGLAEEEVDELHYRRRSLLDLVSERAGSSDQVVLLDEHYRSQPRIIAFSNREFYRDRLRVMTQRPETVRHPSLELRRVQGRREESGVNRAEAEALVAELEGWVEAERHLSRVHSLGVLSPFRAQVDYLTALIGRRVDGATIARHRLLVGTAHGFQGEERDLMLLSLTVDPASSPGSFRFMARPDVFNVAVTRARDLEVVFSSVAPEEAPEGLLRRFLGHLLAPPEELVAATADDRFLAEVAAALEARGCRVWPAYPVAGREVDLMVERGGTSVGVDLVGQRGRFREPFSLERYRMARRAGLKLLPLPLSAWRRDPEACLAAVVAAIG